MCTSRYTQSPPVDHTRVSQYLCVLFVISLLFPRFETQRKRRYKLFFIITIIIILQKTAINRFLVIKTQNNSRFSNSITHKYINTFDYHYFIGSHYRRSKRKKKKKKENQKKTKKKKKPKN